MGEVHQIGQMCGIFARLGPELQHTRGRCAVFSFLPGAKFSATRVFSRRRPKARRCKSGLARNNPQRWPPFVDAGPLLVDICQIRSKFVRTRANIARLRTMGHFRATGATTPSLAATLSRKSIHGPNALFFFSAILATSFICSGDPCPRCRALAGARVYPHRQASPPWIRSAMSSWHKSACRSVVGRDVARWRLRRVPSRARSEACRPNFGTDSTGLGPKFAACSAPPGRRRARSWAASLATPPRASTSPMSHARRP